jgi:hypothetical protein
VGFEPTGKDPMISRKLLSWAVAISVVAAVVATGAMAGRGTSTSVVTIKAVSPPLKVVVNRYIQDNLRWNKDVYRVNSGDTLRIVNIAAGEGPHTLTVVAKKDAPRTGAQMENCKICEKLGKAHGADPSSDAPPKFPFLENGVGQATAPSVDVPGDSGLTGSGKKGEHIDMVVTAPSGSKLYFMCLIHPWMQAEVDVN